MGGKKKTMLRIFCALTALLALPACDAASVITPTTLLLASGAVIINEDKTPTDLIASAVTGLDCDTIRQNKDKGPLCRPEQIGVIEPPIFCYRTLGNINCFSEPDPYGYDEPEVNSLK